MQRNVQLPIAPYRPDRRRAHEDVRPRSFLRAKRVLNQRFTPGIFAPESSYPYPNTYRPWPGPNSNTFLAQIARQVPDLAIQLPSNAVGKDFLPGGGLFAAAPSGSGFQLSLYGLFGILLAAREGLEVNLLGLGLGVDPVRPALKLPALGRLGMVRL